MIDTYLTIIICRLISDNDYNKMYTNVTSNLLSFGFEKYRYILINSTYIELLFQQTK